MSENDADLTARDITCQEVTEWTSAYLDAHAGEDRNIRIALHLATCAGCEAYVRQIASVRDLIGSLPKTVMIPPTPDRLRQAMAARRGQQ